MTVCRSLRPGERVPTRSTRSAATIGPFPNRLGGSGCGTLTNPGNPNNYIKTQCFAVPTAPSPAFWSANCDPAPPSLGTALAPGDLRCFNLRGNAGRNILIGPGVTSLDFSLFQEQLHQENLGEVQHSVPRGDLQHSQPPELCSARQPHQHRHFRWNGCAEPCGGLDYKDNHNSARNSVCDESDFLAHRESLLLLLDAVGLTESGTAARIEAWFSCFLQLSAAEPCCVFIYDDDR